MEYLWEKGYSNDGMFKLSIIEINVITYHVDSSILWPATLGHLNCSYLRYMLNNYYINCNDNHEGKCEIYVEAK